MLKFISRLAPMRVQNVYAVQPIKFYSSQTNPSEKTENTSESNEAENDKLFKRVEIELRSIDPAVMKSYATFATTAAKHLGIEVGDCWIRKRPYDVERYTLLKSAFVHKKHRVQYEIRTYYQFMHFHRLTGSTLSTFLEYIERNLPEGVSMKATKIELLPLPDHIKQPPASLNKN